MKSLKDVAKVVMGVAISRIKPGKLLEQVAGRRRSVEAAEPPPRVSTPGDGRMRVNEILDEKDAERTATERPRIDPDLDGPPVKVRVLNGGDLEDPAKARYQWMRSSEIDEDKLVQAGDILIAARGVRRVVVITAEEDLVEPTRTLPTSSIIVVRPRKIESAILSAFLSSAHVRRTLERGSRSSSQWLALSPRAIEALQISTPDKHDELKALVESARSYQRATAVAAAIRLRLATEAVLRATGAEVDVDVEDEDEEQAVLDDSPMPTGLEVQLDALVRELASAGAPVIECIAHAVALVLMSGSPAWGEIRRQRQQRGAALQALCHERWPSVELDFDDSIRFGPIRDRDHLLRDAMTSASELLGDAAKPGQGGELDPVTRLWGAADRLMAPHLARLGRPVLKGEVVELVQRLALRPEAPDAAPTLLADPCCGAGALLARAPGIPRRGQEADPALVALATLRLGTGISRANVLMPSPTEKPEGAAVVSVLPHSRLNWDPEAAAGCDRLTRLGMAPARFGQAALLQHALDLVGVNGSGIPQRGVLVVPNGLLFRGGPEAEIRGELVKRGLLRAVVDVGCPYFGSSAPGTILVLGQPPGRIIDVVFIRAHTLRPEDVTRFVDGAAADPHVAVRVAVADVVTAPSLLVRGFVARRQGPRREAVDRRELVELDAVADKAVVEIDEALSALAEPAAVAGEQVPNLVRTRRE